MKRNSNDIAWLIRRHVVEMTRLSGGSHLAGMLSEADILAVLYCDILHTFPNDPKNENRDYFILSKGHCGGGLYACLAELGYFDIDVLKTHYQNGSMLSGHVSHKKVPGVDVSTGSLGHGLSYALGIAYALKKDNKNNKVFCLVGDGECDEGSVWEAALVASTLKLDNLYVVVDRNKMQAMDFTEKIVKLDLLKSKWESFNWNTYEIDGHNHQEIKDTILSSFNVKDKPHVVIANTVKGKGIPFMENDILWHYRYPHEGQEYDDAVKALNKIKPDGVKDPYIK